MWFKSKVDRGNWLGTTFRCNTVEKKNYPHWKQGYYFSGNRTYDCRCTLCLNSRSESRTVIIFLSYSITNIFTRDPINKVFMWESRVKIQITVVFIKFTSLFLSLSSFCYRLDTEVPLCVSLMSSMVKVVLLMSKDYHLYRDRWTCSLTRCNHQVSGPTDNLMRWLIII